MTLIPFWCAPPIQIIMMSQEQASMTLISKFILQAPNCNRIASIRLVLLPEIAIKLDKMCKKNWFQSVDSQQHKNVILERTKSKCGGI